MAFDLTIPQLVKAKPAFAGVADDVIALQLKILLYLLQPQTGKSDAEVEDETKYSVLEKLFFADYTALTLLEGRVISQAAGTGDAAAAAAGPLKTVKRAKADVVEVEYEIVKSKDATLSYSVDQLFDLLKKEVCTKARQLGYTLDICGTPEAAAPLFRFYDYGNGLSY